MAFMIEELAEPKQVGATLRHYRLYYNGQPALGRQWHARKADAEAAAAYIQKSGYINRIMWLEQRVHDLECELARKTSTQGDIACSARTK